MQPPQRRPLAHPHQHPRQQQQTSHSHPKVWPRNSLLSSKTTTKTPKSWSPPQSTVSYTKKPRCLPLYSPTRSTSSVQHISTPTNTVFPKSHPSPRTEITPTSSFSTKIRRSLRAWILYISPMALCSTSASQTGWKVQNSPDTEILLLTIQNSSSTTSAHRWVC
ncbi:hypothetical protein E4T44_05764 [Aureobasidium sp. EXF-8845]|nr:hypothetical protein E4T44_05764 [Aureobasidium sp. EXF-8845]KAI4849915.1 hypothetical protein E4T45_05722 [Aureobasidium sp. EXF-8846]